MGVDGKSLFEQMSEEKKRQIGRIFYEAMMKEREEERRKAELADQSGENGGSHEGDVATA